MQRITEVDKYIFNLINNRWQNPFFDALLPMVRNANFWIPLYLFFMVFVLANLKKGGWYVLLTVCTVALTDIISSHIIKESFYRLRPCNNPDLIGTIRVLASYCPQNSSFTSSHAANHFGLATFASVTLYPITGRWIYLTYFWAFVIVYAQMYVGVHYPTDILGGTFIGIMAGLLTAWIYRKKWGTLNLVNQAA